MSETFVERLKKRAEDKATWPNGPWSIEPDLKQWTDEATGLECLLMRGPSGAWCGYVGVNSDHPAFGFDYYKSDLPLDDVLSGKADMRRARIQSQINNIVAHGGLTFSSEGDGKFRPAEFFWFGFDCAHAGDFSPKYDEIEKIGKPTGWGTTEEYRTLDYAMHECTSLALQLAEIDPDKIALTSGQGK